MARRKNSTEKLISSLIKDILPPPPDLTVSEWADQFRKLSSEASAEPGQWRTDRAPYQREIMDSVNDPELKKIVVMSSAQVGKSELLLNTVGYHVDFDPAPILLIQPTEDKAKAFSKERLAPMIRDTPVLRKKVADSKTRDGGNTTLQKAFPGGYIALGGANAPSGLASRPIRILLADEVDRFPVSAGSEGDPLSLAEKRTNNFYNAKKIFVSTPTNKGVSRIEKEFELSTQEHWNLPCPSCDEYQPLRWAQISFESVSHACKYCGSLHNEYEWKNQHGKWIAENPDSPTRGFHLNELVSPWSPWQKIIDDFKTAKKNGPEAMKVWVNTSLGETWEEDGEQVEEDELLARSEHYEASIPYGVKLLTAAVDVQDDRFEIEVVGWGSGKESWGIHYHTIYGDLKQQVIWDDLDEYLSRTWENVEGNRYSIACTCVDSGGHFTSEVYRFCAPRKVRRIFPIKGEGGNGGEHKPLLIGVSKRQREKVNLFRIGVDEGKAKVMSRLQVENQGPGYCHFPIGNGYGANYFKGLTAEKLVTRYKQGVPYQVWQKVRERNEPIDLRVYNTAALEILNPDLDNQTLMSQPKKRKRKRRRRSSRGM
ncbi:MULTISPECIES: phage terminase large subunit family protein [Pontibacillus]|uniref:Phage terminase large subunit family protein n=1 Tax=Pontibacillus chungwhensis TaxID=265426 RepID=A0ABY8V2A2_9BACI|nr:MULTISPECIES: phage terminase large subunit family protein [Pontibacillus]MCD5324765.1 phage terminase large subunit family protein [Pontibacillus sp. HN14]WIF98725.1 phage terminase large subunit family protein [Pontibacillus chungwhensis]